MNKERFNAFTDAIMAIVLTIMVLEFRIPSQPTWSALGELFQPFLAYLLTFFILWTSWYSHHELFKNIDKITYKLYWAVGSWIVLMSTLPFATAWIGRDFFAFVPELVYFIIGILSFINYHLLMEPEALKNTKLENRPEIRNSRLLNGIRVASILSVVVLIWWFPPIAVINLFVFTFLHVSEHIHIWRIDNMKLKGEE